MDAKMIEKLDEMGRETADRREFLKKAGKVAATVPAVALLLSANATPAEAYNRYGRGGHQVHGRWGLSGYDCSGHPPPDSERGVGHQHHDRRACRCDCSLAALIGIGKGEENG